MKKQKTRERCSKCGVILTPGGNWHHSTAMRRTFICNKCVKIRREKARQRRIANGDWKCPKCGVELDPYRKKPLCEKCTREYYHNYHKKRTDCIVCGKKLPKGRVKYCPECAINVNRIQRADNSLKIYYKQRDELLNELGGECKLCGKTEDLHCHHIIPLVTNDTKYRQYYHYIRHKDILLLICKDCHIKWHEIKEEYELLIM